LKEAIIHHHYLKKSNPNYNKSLNLKAMLSTTSKRWSNKEKNDAKTCKK